MNIKINDTLEALYEGLVAANFAMTARRSPASWTECETYTKDGSAVRVEVTIEFGEVGDVQAVSIDIIELDAHGHEAGPRHTSRGVQARHTAAIVAFASALAAAGR